MLKVARFVPKKCPLLLFRYTTDITNIRGFRHVFELLNSRLTGKKLKGTHTNRVIFFVEKQAGLLQIVY